MRPASLEHRLRAAWQRRGPLACLLWPLSLLYRTALALRPVPEAERLPVPVVVIGNVVAGGAGKTPTTLAVVAHLQSRGWRPGIVSRGHGRRTQDCREVHPTADPRDVGDEPLLLRQRAGVPVFVAARRAQAGRALLAAHPACDVLVCDDGLQHQALARDVEICVFDARGTGNGWLLPAGPLREPWPRAVDLVLCTEPAPALPAPHAFTATRRLADHALRADGTRVPLATLRGQPLAAVAGIARPEAFFDMLRAAGLTLARTTALPDHFGFEHFQTRDDALICTEKDAIKLWRHTPAALAVPLVLDVPPAFFGALTDRLAAQGYHPQRP
ncbi:MAG: tetraacyldisaccharide 4'-kinase [Pseudomonadota bacterium]|nr:tetraacyldisaccharide 4'-kinase [Pseudomonadota bacterium]